MSFTDFDSAATDEPGSELIYRQASGLERAMADTDAVPLIEMRAELIVENWDPYLVQSRNLPFLAWGMGDQLWRQSWPEETRRRWTAEQWQFKALRGTEAGIRMALAVMAESGGDIELVDVVVPPQRAFASANVTKEQMDLWLAQMPQLRVYLGDELGDGTGLSVVDGDGAEDENSDGTFVGDGFAAFDAGAGLYGRKARLRLADGTEVPIKIATITNEVEDRPAVNIEQASIPGVGGFSFAGSAYATDDAFCGDEAVPPQLFTYSIDTTYRYEQSELALNFVAPGLDPIDVRQRRTSDIGDGDSCGFCGDFAAGPFFARWDMAAWLMFDFIRLYDPNVRTPIVDAISFYGHARAGIAPQKAELMIQVEGYLAAPYAATSRFVTDSFAGADDTSRLSDAMDAVEAAKALRDQILVTFQTSRARTLGDGFPLDGSVTLRSRLPARLD